MPRIALGEKSPHVHESAFVAANATLIGDVRVGAESGIWYGVVIRGDRDTITIGARCNIQDLTVMHTDPDFHLELGDNTSVGHRAILHGCRTEGDVLIGMGAIVMNGATIGRGSVIGAGALVPAGVQIPPNSLVIGAPGKVRRETTQEERGGIAFTAEHYAQLRLEHLAGRRCGASDIL